MDEPVRTPIDHYADLPAGFEPVQYTDEYADLPEGFKPMRVPTPDEINQQLQQSLSTEGMQVFNDQVEEAIGLSPDPEQQRAKIYNSLFLSAMTGENPTEIHKQHDNLARVWTGNDKEKPDSYLERLKNTFIGGFLPGQIMPYGWEQMMGNDSPELEAQIQEMESHIPTDEALRNSLPTDVINQADIPAKFKPLVWLYTKLGMRQLAAKEGQKQDPLLADMVLEAANILPMQLQALQNAFPWMTTTMGGTAAAGLLAFALGNPAAAGTAAALLPLAAKGGFMVGSTEFIGKVEAVMSYRDLMRLEYIDEHGNKIKINPVYAKSISLGIGAINAALENLQITRLLTPFMGEKFAKKALQEATQRVLMDGRLGKYVAKKVLKGGIDYAKDIAIETAQEMAQEAVTMIGAELAKYISNKVDKTEFENNWKDFIPQLIDVGVRSAKGFAILGAAGSVLRTSREIAATVKEKGDQTAVIEALQKHIPDLTPAEAMSILKKEIASANKQAIATAKAIKEGTALKTKKRIVRDDGAIDLPSPDFLAPEAKQMKTVEEFTDYVNSMYLFDQDMEPATQKAVDNKLTEFYNEVHEVDEPGEPIESHEEWAKNLTRDSVFELFEGMMDKRPKGLSPLLWGAAWAEARGNMTDKQWKRVEVIMRNNPAKYRGLIAELTGDTETIRDLVAMESTSVVPTRTERLHKYDPDIPVTLDSPAYSIETTDGNVYYDNEALSHTDAAGRMGIDPEHISRVGFITKEGVYRPGKAVANEGVEFTPEELEELKPATISPDAMLSEIIEAEEQNSFIAEMTDNPAAQVKQGDKVSGELASAFESFKDVWFGNKDVRIFMAKQEQKALTERLTEIVKEMGVEKKEVKSQAILYDKAIQIFIDTKRDPSAVDRHWDALSTEKQELIYLSRNLPAPIQVVADEIAQAYKDIGREMKDNEVIRNLLDNYANRVWDLSGKEARESARKFGTTSGHAKHRTFTTIIEGWAAGYELKVQTATNSLSIYKQEAVKVVEDKKLLKALAAAKDIDGNPLLSTTELPGYKAIKNPNFKVWKYAGEVVEGETYGKNFFVTSEGTVLERKELYAPEKIAKNINNILGTSKLAEQPVVKALTKFNAITKAMILVSSFFHHLAYVASFYLGTNHKKWSEMNVVQASKAGREAMKAMQPELMLGIRSGLTLGVMQDWNQELVMEGTALERWMDQKGIAKDMRVKIKQGQQWWASQLFESFGAGLKAKSFLIEYRNQLKKYPGTDPDVLAKRVANLINDDFGGLHLGRMGRNPTTQHIARLLFLATDWTESNFRTVTKAMGFVIEGGEFKKLTKEERAMYQNFWIKALTKGMAATLFLNFMLAGGDPDRLMDNYERAYKEGNLRVLDVDITPIYKAMGGETRNRKYFSLIKHFKDPIKWALHPIKSIRHKASVGVGTAIEGLTQEDWAGRKFTTFSELIKEGETVTWRYEKAPKTDYSMMPSFIINQLIGFTPIQVQNFLAAMSGEQEWFESVGNMMGLGIRTTY